MIRNFRFLDGGRIALSGFPESAAAVDWLYAQGIRTVVSLHPVPTEAGRRMAELGIAWLPFPIEDVRDALPAGLPGVLAQVNAAADPVLIHCQGGGGRSGTIAAAALVCGGATAEEALDEVGGLEKDAQRAFLRGFAAARNR